MSKITITSQTFVVLFVLLYAYEFCQMASRGFIILKCNIAFDDHNYSEDYSALDIKRIYYILYNTDVDSYHLIG